jgi:ferredoxin
VGQKHSVRLQPVGIDIEVDEDESVLHGAFRQGIMLMHGCKEGQCSACKSFLLDGEIDMDSYSTFALPDFEKDEGWVLLCRTHAYSDIEVELFNYDEEILRSGIPIQTRDGVVESVENLTHDICKLVVKIDEPLDYRAGQYVDLTPAGADFHRSFSMANPPSDDGRLEFMIKMYPGGRFSGLLGDEGAQARRRHRRGGPLRPLHAALLLRTGRSCSSAAAPGCRPSRRCWRPWPRTTSSARGLLLRRPHGGRPLPPRGARGPDRDAARLQVHPALSSPTRPRPGTGRRASSRTSATAWRWISRKSTPTSAGRRPWSTRPSPCWSAGAFPRNASTSTSSPSPLRRKEKDGHEHTHVRRAGQAGRPEPVIERSVPKPVFTDAEAGAKEFPSSKSRSYNYFTPAKRRATVYEDVTIDVQPDPERHLSQGWVYGFADGPGGYPKEWTALKSTNWHVFLDPNEEWEQTIYRNNASVVRHLQQNVANAKAAGSFARGTARG